MKTLGADDLIKRLNALANCDARYGEPLGKCMREAAAALAGLKDDLEYWKYDSATAWDRCEEHRLTLLDKDAEIAKLRADRDCCAVFCGKLMERRDALVVAKDAEIARLTAEMEAWKAAQHYTYIGKDGKPVLARTLEDRAEKAEAENERLREAYRLEAMRRPDYTHEAFDAHLAALTGEKTND